jgi:hypothetical protein
MMASKARTSLPAADHAQVRANFRHPWPPEVKIIKFDRRAVLHHRDASSFQIAFHRRERLSAKIMTVIVRQ